jgi:hypothetical protein
VGAWRPRLHPAKSRGNIELWKFHPKRGAVMDSKLLILRGVVKHEGEYWASIVLDFNIVGTGDTPEAAVACSIWMAQAYLEEGLAAHKNVESLKRPVPLSARARYQAAHLTSRVLGGRMLWGREEAMPFERRVFLACAA